MSSVCQSMEMVLFASQKLGCCYVQLLINFIGVIQLAILFEGLAIERHGLLDMGVGLIGRSAVWSLVGSVGNRKT